MPTKAQLSGETRQKIIALRGTASPAEIGDKFGIKANFVSQIWFRAAHSERKIPVRHVRREKAPQAPVLPDDDPIVDHGVTLMQLDHPHCRWPVGKDHDGNLRFCGCERYRSNVYEIRKQENTKSVARFKSFYCQEHYIASLSAVTLEQRAFIGRIGKVSSQKHGILIDRIAFDARTFEHVA